MQTSLRRKISGMIPQPVRFNLRKIAYSGKAHQCPLCGNSVSTYIAHGGGFEVLDRRKVVGGMRRDNDQCPVCRSADRTRLMMLYLKNVIGVGKKPVSILHVAPDFGLYLWLKRQGQVTYCATDLDVSRYRHMENLQSADLTNLPFEAGKFDIVVCSHVLEHIPDDRKAMGEIFRVLKKGGTAVLMVPLATDGKGTEEDLSIADPQERERLFGQWDHVRLYGRDDFFVRLKNVGFTVQPFNGFDQFQEEAKKLSLNPSETLVAAQKS